MEYAESFANSKSESEFGLVNVWIILLALARKCKRECKDPYTSRLDLLHTQLGWQGRSASFNRRFRMRNEDEL